MCYNDIVPEVLDYFSCDPHGPLFELHKVANNSEHELFPYIEKQFAAFSYESIADIKTDKNFLSKHVSQLSTGGLDRKARFYKLLLLLEKSIPQKRLNALSMNHTHSRPQPYNHSSLSDIELTTDHLVPLSDFKVSGTKLVRNNTAFTVAPPLKSLNALYWLMGHISKSSIFNETFVRLDPLLVKPEKEFPDTRYFMLVHGRSLDWDRIARLKKADHGKWIPDDSSTLPTYAQFTDYAWIPRGAEIHFICEELPSLEDISLRGSRYFHAVYLPKEQVFTHMDGAIRIYNKDTWMDRYKTHVRKAGKSGRRVKIFRIDSKINRELFANLCVSYFVWNCDVAKYFGEAIN